MVLLDDVVLNIEIVIPRTGVIYLTLSLNKVQIQQEVSLYLQEPNPNSIVGGEISIFIV